MNTIEIENKFTGFKKSYRTKKFPAISTIQKHLKNSKCEGCKSSTSIKINGEFWALDNIGNGLELFKKY